MAADNEYKAAKESFVSGATGSSVGHINFISLVALVTIFLYYTLHSRLSPQRSLPFVLEWIVLVVPLLLSITLFAFRPLLLTAGLVSLAGTLMLFPRKDLPSFLPSISRPSSPTHTHTHKSSTMSRSKLSLLPAVTTYRAHMMLMTALGIIAVDFPVFPRELAKCETFGVSLMDLGVGSFVFSQGLVSALPIVKDPTYLRAPVADKLGKTGRKAFPMFALGIVRVLLVKGTDYPEHVSEYGVHWNFFLTLSILAISQVFFHPFLIKVPAATLGLVLALSHQIALSWLGLADYVLNGSRANLIGANREGLVSLTGYLAIQLLGLAAGTVLFPRSPSSFRHRRKALSKSGAHRDSSSSSDSEDSDSGKSKALVHRQSRQSDKTIIELSSYSILFWTLLAVTRLLKFGFAVSRRMANLQYILWIAAFNTSFLCGYMGIDIFFSRRQPSQPAYRSFALEVVSPMDTSRDEDIHRPPLQAPKLLAAVNKNGLAFFLAANIVTGLINLSMSTMYASHLVAMIVLLCYALGLSVLAWSLRSRKLW